MDLHQIRSEIDSLDLEIVKLLALRQDLVRTAARHKRNEQEVRAFDRQEQVLNRVVDLAREYSLSPNVAKATFRAIISSFVELELTQQEQNSDTPTR